MRRPIMNDPTQLASLEGQQYLVLRPTQQVADEFVEVQDAARRALPDDVRYPHTGHVTLRGFYEAERLDDLKTVIRGWARSQHPITITVDAIDTFPTPWQILIMRLAHTGSLVSAYASLTSLLADTDIRRLDERSLEDWTFHLSVVYGKTLDATSWAEVESAMTREYSEPPTEVITEAELVWFHGGAEHSEVVPLGTA